MEKLINKSILSHRSDTLQAVREAYNLHQPGRIDEAVDRLQEWLRSQHHFNKREFNRHYLETVLINSKGLVEKAKQYFDNNFAMKTLVPKFFSINTRLLDSDSFENIISTPLPKLTKDHYRVILVQNRGKKLPPNLPADYCTLCVYMLENMLRWNYSMGLILVLDLRDVDLTLILHLLSMEKSRQALMILPKAYKIRLQALHIISNSKIVEVLLNFVKSIVSEKILGRVFVHKTLDSLYEHIDKDLFPSDYGGQEKKTSQEMSNDILEIMCSDESVAYVKEMSQTTIDFSKKPSAEFNEQYMGMAGTFRTLHID